MIRITAAAIAALCAASIPAPAAAQTNAVTVIRGSLPAAGRTAAGVEIVYGTPVAAPRSPSVAADAEPPAYGTTGRQAAAPQPFAAGNTLWFREADTGRLTACWVGGSGYVGVSVIRCTDRRAY